MLLGGEAGVGKTSLVRAFVQRLDGVRVLRGACDDLAVPRALGPFLDMDHDLGGVLASAPAATARHEAFAALLHELGRETSVVVLEDVHWADEATLDAIVFLGRRVADLPVLLVLSYRSDELAAAHPLRAAVASLPPNDVRRIRLEPLSAGAVARLAGPGDDAARLHALTGGNPFFLTEVLAGDRAAVPATVQDAVLAKVAKLPPEARACVELVAVVPAKCEHWLLDAAACTSDGAVADCVDSGVLTADGEGLCFRHELARRAVEEALTAVRRRALNRAVLGALRARDGVDPARLAHHAFEAGDEESSLDLALGAARHASRSGAHREALALLERAVPLFGRLQPVDRAEAFEDLRHEAFVGGRIALALEAAQQAVELRRALGDGPGVGDALRWASLLSWASADPETADALADEAIEVLEPLPRGRELAAAYANRSRLYLFAHRNHDAVEWGLKAIALARSVEDWETVAETQVNVGSALVPQDPEEGIAVLEEAVATADEHGLSRIAARGLMNGAWGHQLAGDLRRADAVLTNAIDFARSRDQEAMATHGIAHLADLRLRLGRWEEAETLARDAIARSAEMTVSRADAVLVVGRLQARRGDDDARRTLDEAWRLAEEFGELPLLAPAAAGLAELHWLTRDDAAALAAVDEVYGLALQVGSSWDVGELAFWRWRAGGLEEPPTRCAEPYRLQILGDWGRAAAAWARLGQPYERALALLDADDARAALEGLQAAVALGAQPLEARLRAALRGLGVRTVPRGPRAATRRNPAGLSARQLEVLGLVSEGLTNAEIARRLVLSAKTVDHHVSAILTKLRVDSRHDAAAAARRLGIAAKDGEGPTPT